MRSVISSFAALVSAGLLFLSISAFAAESPDANPPPPPEKHHSMLKGAAVGAAGGGIAKGKHGAEAGAVGGALIQHHRNKKAEKRLEKGE